MHVGRTLAIPQPDVPNTCSHPQNIFKAKHWVSKDFRTLYITFTLCSKVCQRSACSTYNNNSQAEHFMSTFPELVHRASTPSQLHKSGGDMTIRSQVCKLLAKHAPNSSQAGTLISTVQELLHRACTPPKLHACWKNNSNPQPDLSNACSHPQNTPQAECLTSMVLQLVHYLRKYMHICREATIPSQICQMLAHTHKTILQQKHLVSMVQQLVHHLHSGMHVWRKATILSQVQSFQQLCIGRPRDQLWREADCISVLQLLKMGHESPCWRAYLPLGRHSCNSLAL